MLRDLNFYNTQRIFPALVMLILFGCGSDEEPSIDCSSSNLQATVGNVTEASCGLENGGFDITISGGSGPFQLTVSGSGTQSVSSGTNSIENIGAGNYNLTIRDNDNCSATANVTISDINDVAIEAEMVASGCQSSDGTITVTASGGNEPYMYSLDGGAMQPSNVFTGLSMGDYTALVSDADGCQTSLTVSVLSGVSYNDNITPLINTHCAISNCHDGSNGALPNWTDLATVQANAENIKTRTADMTMPPAGRPDLEAQEIQAIACWVDDGALDN